MRTNWIAAAVLGALLLSPPALEAPRAQGAPSAATARVIVKYRAGAELMRTQAAGGGDQKSAQMRSLGKRLGVDLVAGAAVADRTHVVFAAGTTAAALAARLAADADVEYALPDRRMHALAVPNDPFYGSRPYDNAAAPSAGGPLVGQWYLKPPAATGGAGGSAVSSVNAEQAWDITTGSAAVVVAVLDTGVRFDHPDFRRVAAGGNLLDGYDFVSGDGSAGFLTANDGDGRDADASDPGDFVTAAEVANVPTFKDCDATNSSWHGTQTLGLIGAQTNNGVGVASVGRDVRVLPVRVIGKCGGFESDIVAAMRWAAGKHVDGVPDNANPARVINMSLGGAGACEQLYQDTVAEVVAAGAVVVVSAGNDGTAVSAPANCPGVIGVAGLRSDGDKGGISSLGPEVAISAPSANCPTGSPCTYPILTAFNAGTTTPVAGGTYTGSFIVFQGTSFSAPLVAGAAALMLSVQPSLTPAEIKARLQSSARPFPSGGSSITPNPGLCAAPTATAQVNCYCTTTTCGAGMLDVHAAVLAAIGAQARIAVVTATPVAGQAVTLSAAGSVAGNGRSIASYAWTLVDGGGIVTGFDGGIASGATVSLTPAATGSFSVSLTVTDDTGVASTTTTTVAVAAAAVVTPPSSSSGGGGGGGGAVGVGWLVLLLGAVLALAVASRRERAAKLSAARSGRG